MAITNAERCRRYRLRHPDRVKSSRRTQARRRLVADRLYQRERAALAQAFIDAAHADGCVDCGNKNLSQLQSDHVRGEKVDDVSRMVHGSLPRLFAELEKCETRCITCHAKVSRARQKAAA